MDIKRITTSRRLQKWHMIKIWFSSYYHKWVR